jgi:hypothetical protein
MDQYHHNYDNAYERPLSSFIPYQNFMKEYLVIAALLLIEK